MEESFIEIILSTKFGERVEKGKTERIKDEKGFNKQGCLIKDAREKIKKGPEKV